MSDSAVDYTSIHVATLRGDLKIPFDVYVRVAGKFIHYCRAGDSFEGKRLERLKAKKIKTMFIKPEDELPYKIYLQQSLDAAYDFKSGKSLEVRAEVIQGFQQAETEKFMEEPLNNLQYDALRTSVQRFVEFVSREAKAAGAILRIQNIDLSVTHHCVNVAALTIALMAELKKESPQLSLLALGCMIHDIDHHTNGLDLMKSPTTMNESELAIYRAHPAQGVSRLTGATFTDQLVMNVVLQHEENSNGSGFPRALHEKDIDPLVLIAAAANAYDRLVSLENRPPKEAVKHMMIDKLGLYRLSHLQGIQRVLKAQGII